MATPLEPGEEAAKADQAKELERGEKIALIDLIIILARRKRLVLGVPLAVAAVVALVSLLIPNTYTAIAKILPPQQSQSSAALFLGQFTTLSQLGDGFGLRQPSDLFVSMLRSRSVSDAIIERFDLKKLYDKDLLDDARRKLNAQREISTARDGVITIRVDDHDAVRAAAMANAHAEELEKLTMDLAVSEASQRRLLFEKQLRKAKDELGVAEVSLKKFQQESGLITPVDQARLTVSASASLRAQITAKEVQLAAMRSFATTQNPDIIRTQQEVAALRSQLARIEKEPSQSPGDLIVPIGRVPETSLEFIRKYRDVKYYETLFELLAKQYELARVDEAKNATLIQLLDRAIPPERKSKPNRTLIVLFAAFTALLLTVMWVFGRELDARQHAGEGKVDQLWSHLFSHKQ